MNSLFAIDALRDSARAVKWEALPSSRNHHAVHSHSDAQQEVRSAGGRVTAHCSLWWRNTPPFNGQRLGLVGHYSAEDDESGLALLEQACAQLAARGCTLAIGPMDGSTWHGYRLVTEKGPDPPFFLEPHNPAQWPEQFARAGFTPLATYCSALVETLDYEAPKAKLAEKRLTALGVRLCPLDPGRWDTLLREAYRVTTTCFQKGFLYQPLPEPEFLELYEQVRPCLRPELILFAMHEKRMVGYLFTIPDVLQAQRGEPIDTVILKTLAILPGRQYAGLGWYLTQQTHRAAHQLGYRRAIHALMHESNISLNISTHYGKVFRRYTLFSRPL
jgi:hypothetical protein